MHHISQLPHRPNDSTYTSRPFSTYPKLESIALSRLILQAVASAFDISERELSASTRRCSAVSFARQVAMYLAHTACGYSLTEVGQLFQRDRTTAAYACRKIEDRRDDPNLDFSLDCLESAVRNWQFQQNYARVPNEQ